MKIPRGRVTIADLLESSTIQDQIDDVSEANKRGDVEAIGIVWLDKEGGLRTRAVARNRLEMLGMIAEFQDDVLHPEEE